MTPRPDRPRLPRGATTSLTALIAASLLLAGCAAPTSPVTDGPTGDDDHGHVEGAAELDEPHPALLVLGEDGALELLDLLDESRVDLGTTAAPEATWTDGRFAASLAPGRVALVDSGRWTRPHGDHSHYYEAPPRLLEAVTASEAAAETEPPRLQSSEGRTSVLFPGSGELVVLDRESLGQGEIAELTRAVHPGSSAAIPVGEAVLLGDAGAGRARLLDDDGEELASEACPDPAGARLTRVGAVLGCADGAVLAVSGSDGVELERIPFGEAGAGDPPPAATAFASRLDRPATAGVAGDRGAWVLDSRARTWSLVETERPLALVAAIDDDEDRVVAIDRTGRLLVLDPASGDTVSASEPLADAAGLEGAALTVDADRAYLALPHAGRVLELDYRDGGTVAREFEVPRGAVALETGR
ncbi:ABC transporter [Homoserinibacter sp. YIM 151385]|uniref:ABC transporter n=1 Tax=Homoserinibacter sp. YIM 151385 TaxID=2985506 RepID=UPI0022F134AA|nr:ABC transporter [Homoserinibacter sp. YIM 151385]WBU38070.1 ABC transporter [Homoserinibacter sp. YIM 151385]